MGKYVIITDSSSDLSKEFRLENNVDYAKMTINWTEKDGTTREEFASIDWDVLSIKEFYDILRNGIRIFTSQITEENYLNTFVPHLEKGEDIIYLACSSGLSASLKTAELLVEGQLKERFPDRKIVVIDSLRAGMALGLLVMEAVKLKNEGKTFEEVVQLIESIKTQFKEVGIPDSLSYLKRAGRVKATQAFFGNIIGLKPILVFNEVGGNEAKEKAIGKKAAFEKMSKMIAEDIVNPIEQTIYLMSADCKQEDIEMFKEVILKEVKVKEIVTEPLGPIIGASSGPGTIIVNYRGK